MTALVPPRRRQAGFTMIELIMVIVVLGILAAIAMPRFVDLGDDARSSVLSGVTGAAASAMTVNFSGCAVSGHVPGAKCTKVSNCSDTGSLLQGGLPTGYTIAPAALGTGAAGSNGIEASCTVTQTATALTATFTGISAGN